MEFVDRRTLFRYNPTPPSRDTATYPLRCGGNRHLAMVRQLSPNSIALASPSRVPHREAQTTCGQKNLILYTASGYIDQQTKKFVRRGRNACLEELKEKYGVKISGSTLDRIVRMGKEAKGNQVCFVRKKYDATKLSYLTAEVREDYVELITEFAHTWRRLTIRHLHLLMQGKGYEFCKSTVSNHLHAMNMRYKTIHLKPILIMGLFLQQLTVYHAVQG